ncbi:MAG TPA: S8 family serine peptidase, partial [Bryobacteraceae bacterium]|nr:S8 family serine peptidase [Bryobacteraceae bacterium]
MLQDPPVATRFASRFTVNSSQAAAYRRQIEDRQAIIKRDLQSRRFSVTGSTSVLLNAIFVNAPANRVDELRAISGVAAVRPMRRFRPLLNRATQLLNAPMAWQKLGGPSNAGAGIKIAILDSGIDQNHPAFQDPNLPMPAGFPKCTDGHPEDCAYTNNKVIVARSYVRLVSAGSDPKNPSADSLPDDYSPRDRDGHGTGVASSAAAVSVTVPGVSATGTALNIQGVAPKAYLGNYKIAGSPGVAEFATDQTLIQAVEDAVMDGMDVITTSWGSNAVSDFASDPTAAAFEAAAKTGAVVLAAAGNAGEDAAVYPSFNTISSPSNAPDVISVGATENSHVLLPSVSVISSGAPAGLKGIPAQPSDAYNYPSSNGVNSGPLVDVTTLGDDGLACAPLPANSLIGSFALVERGTCTFATKAANVQSAGGIGLIIYWADSSSVTPITGLGQNNPRDANFIGPAVSISNSAGVLLKNYLEANPGQRVSIDAGGMEMDISAWSQQYGFSPTVTSNMLVGFSSTGPTPDGQMKPDAVAVGGNDIGYLLPESGNPYVPAPSGIYMATQSYDPNQSSSGGSNYSANGYWAADGTSFATPMAAGAAALVKQARANQNLRGTQIRSLLLNSASQAVTTEDSGIPIDAQWIGAGMVDAGAAVAATLTAEPATVSFGILNKATFPIARTIAVTNIGSAAASLSPSVVCCTVNGMTGTLSNASVSVAPATLTLAPGASGSITATLSGTLPVASEYSGSILLQQGGTTLARVPFMMLVGDGMPHNANALVLGGEGAPGQDIGPAIVQVTDQYGVPVANSPVVFNISPGGGVSLQSISGVPACAVAVGTVTCNTDEFGFAYAEVINGMSATSVRISSTIAGHRVSGTVKIQPAPSTAGIADAAAGLKAVAPGSYIAIYGTGLSNYTDVNSTVYNPNSTPTAQATDPVIANGA